VALQMRVDAGDIMIEKDKLASDDTVHLSIDADGDAENAEEENVALQMRVDAGYIMIEKEKLVPDDTVHLSIDADGDAENAEEENVALQIRVDVGDIMIETDNLASDDRLHLSIDSDGDTEKYVTQFGDGSIHLPEFETADSYCQAQRKYGASPFGGSCRKSGFSSKEECWNIDMAQLQPPTTVAIQFNEGVCHFYRLSGEAPTDCPDGYKAASGTDQMGYFLNPHHEDNLDLHCKVYVPWLIRGFRSF